MNCSLCQKNLSAYLDGKLPIDILSLTEAHLDNCTQCSTLLNEMKSLYAVIEEEKGITSSPFIVTRVLAAIEQMETPVEKTSLIRRTIQTVLIAASIAIAVFAGIQSGNLYSLKPAKKPVPDELVYMNDVVLESLTFYETK